MKTELFTVSRIFNEALYRIPDYQRGYAWEDQHLRDFWLDIEQLEEGKSHYTGVLTLEPLPPEVWSSWSDDRWIIESKRYVPYYVVDGQQRLTTIVILLQSLLERELPPKLNHTPIADIRRKYIFDSKDEKTRSYLFGYIVDNPSYEYLKTRIFNELSTKYSTGEDTIYTRNLGNAKQFFMERLAEMSPADLEKIFTKVTQQLVFNVYEIAKEIDVFVTFETMNNRGKLLSSLELLKNRLIYLAMKLEPDAEAAAQMRGTINDAWKSVYHYLGKNELRRLKDDHFLSVHLNQYFLPELAKLPPDVDDDGMFKVLRQMSPALEDVGRFLLNNIFSQKRVRALTPDAYPPLTVNFVHTYSQALKNAIKTYYQLSTPSDSTWSDTEKVTLERMGRLRGHAPSATLLSVYMREKSGKKRSEFLIACERSWFLHTLRGGARHRGDAQWTLAKYNVKHLSLDEWINQIANEVTEFFKEVSISDTLFEWVKNSGGYYGWRSIEYFLFEYELSLAATAKTSRKKIDWASFATEDFATDYVSVEHIYPQKANHSYWRERFSSGLYSSTERRLLRNSLGNLLPLSVPKNSSLSNRPFPEKKDRGVGTVGYAYGGYAENEVAQLEHWGPRQILERGVKLLDFLEVRWGVTIGDRQQKIKALGLDFLGNS